MQPGDRAEFGRVLNGLAAIRRFEITKDAAALWWASMQHWSIEDFRAAASHLVTACQFMPTPYDFEQLRRARLPSAAEAWTQALEGCVHWRTPERLPNGRVERAARAVGGFRAIAMADIERDLPHVQRRFLEAYAELSDVEETRAALESKQFLRLADAR